MSESRALHVLIHGRVQGVSFRAWMQHQAELRGLKGWVRNRQDGSVEAMFSGPADLVQVMLKACHQGPASALVENVETLDGSERDLDLPARFEIRRTA
ncbi:acylphosphatase [Microvirga sp. CF3062]|uniref:acylphosphatase n=1 Tax=Microvirga sp. CF3062 TaxID=3110182 RepID=UPI002E78ED45|nr:acylphosphatase [Microvirga sp. CF3062]MEE1658226.1 acylphosphatase [Microvirga sp. CF3062]